MRLTQLLQRYALTERGKRASIATEAELEEAVTPTSTMRIGQRNTVYNYLVQMQANTPERSYRITVKGETTDTVSTESTPEEIQAALEALPSRGPGDFFVTHDPNYDPGVATFIQFAGTLEGESLETLGIAFTDPPGHDPIPHVEFDMDATSGTWRPSSGAGDPVAFDADAAEIQANFDAWAPDYFTVTGGPLGTAPVSVTWDPGVGSASDQDFQNNWQDIDIAGGDGLLVTILNEGKSIVNMLQINSGVGIDAQDYDIDLLIEHWYVTPSRNLRLYKQGGRAYLQGRMTSGEEPDYNTPIFRVPPEFAPAEPDLNDGFEFTISSTGGVSAIAEFYDDGGFALWYVYESDFSTYVGSNRQLFFDNISWALAS